MTTLAAAALGLVIGAVLGALGGGGAILTVPALVYLLGETAQEATTSSLVIVGVTAIAGMAGHARSNRVRWGTGAVFGGVGMLAAFAGTIANRHVEQHVLLLGFAAAVGTSLLVIAVNSAASLVARTGSSHYDWAVITPFTLAAIIASLAGKRAADRLPPAATTRGFAALVLVVAAFIGVRTLAG